MADRIDADADRRSNRSGASEQAVKKKRPRYRSPTRRIVSGLTKLAVVAYAAIVTTMLLMEPKLVYPGAYVNDDRSVAALPIELIESIESVQYESTDGITLRGRLLENSKSENIVLYFHGNGGKAAWLDSWLQRSAEAFDATVMVAEYRGYEDEITPTEKGVIEDCFSARDYLCQRYGKSPDQIVLYGQSLGGGCAVAVASIGGARALILDRTFDRMVDVAAERYPILPVRFLMRNRYDSMAKLTAYHGPLIQIHGMHDKAIPIEHAQRLFHSAKSDRKHWLVVEGLGHNDSLSEETLTEIATKLNEITLTP